MSGDLDHLSRSSQAELAARLRRLSLSVTAYLVGKALCWASNFLTLVIYAPSPAPGLAGVRNAAAGVVILGVLWSWAAAPVLTPALLRRKRWGWAATQANLLLDGMLLMSSLGTVLIMAIGRPEPGLGWIALALLFEAFWISWAVVLGRQLLREREWFGVEERRAWQTIYREGWWVLSIGLVNMLGTAVLFAMQERPQ